MAGDRRLIPRHRVRFAVRPFGALVFGRLGDLVGRKHTFLITMSLMGRATFLVGLLPSYASIGVAATGDIYYGLWYPTVVAGATLVVGLFFCRRHSSATSINEPLRYIRFTELADH
jgi:MFS family permease